MKIFVSGGCKNGKSSLAEQMVKKLSGDGPLYYIATMIPYDEEDYARIENHRAARAGQGFTTIEQGRNLLEVLEKSDAKNGTYLLDSVTALLLNEMYKIDSPDADFDAARRVSADLREFVKQVKNAVFVSDFIYSDTGHYPEYTKAYRKALAEVDRTLAEVCDTVIEVAAGQMTFYKGENIL